MGCLIKNITFVYVLAEFMYVHRERRAEFEIFLNNERKKMELFRMRETKEFLSVDELFEKCETADIHMNTLEVNLNYRLAVNFF